MFGEIRGSASFGAGWEVFYRSTKQKFQKESKAVNHVLLQCGAMRVVFGNRWAADGLPSVADIPGPTFSAKVQMGQASRAEVSRANSWVNPRQPGMFCTAFVGFPQTGK